jgi:hypothetical protein
MKHDIEAGFDLLVSQASDTAERYLLDAVRVLDKHFGKDYALKNPALLAAMVQAAAADFNHALMKIAAQDIRGSLIEIAYAIRMTGERE